MYYFVGGPWGKLGYKSNENGTGSQAVQPSSRVTCVNPTQPTGPQFYIPVHSQQVAVTHARLTRLNVAELAAASQAANYSASAPPDVLYLINI